MSDSDPKSAKKSAKAAAKTAKAVAKARANGRQRLPGKAGISIRPADHGSELVVSGLSQAQLERILPQLNREIVISVTEDRSTLRAGLMRFVREGIFQTVIKVVAGLVVGFVLIKLGLS